jgi:hypothetical protein
LLYVGAGSLICRGCCASLSDRGDPAGGRALRRSELADERAARWTRSLAPRLSKG